jgi:putative transposase
LLNKDHELSIRQQCKILDIHKSSLYYCPKENFNDYIIMNMISEIHQKFPYYGYRKIHWHLKTHEGQIINRKKVQKLMKNMGIKCIFPGPKTSIANKNDSVFPYLLKNLDIVRPNQVWAVDITYIKLPVGMVYLFAIIDWHSRFVVAHQLVNTMEACHAIETIEMALKLARPEICNADQGSQFTGSLWVEKLQTNNIKISHDGVGRCIDNVRIERFWRTIKYEDIFLKAYNNMSEARAGINVFIKHYNEQRPHPSASL